MPWFVVRLATTLAAQPELGALKLSAVLFHKFWHGLVMPICARLPHGLSDWLCLTCYELNRHYKRNLLGALAQSLPKGIGKNKLGIFAPLHGASTEADLQPLSLKDTQYIGQRSFEMMARECCDIYCLSHRGVDYVKEVVSFTNLDTFRSFYSQPGGKLLILFHFDRLTLISSGLGQMGFPHSMITQPIDHSNPELSEHERVYLRKKVDLIQQMAGGGWFVVGQDTRAILRALKDGQTLILLPDVRPNPQAKGLAKLPFLGQTLTIPDGAIRLAELTGAKMIYAVAKSQARRCEVSFRLLPDRPDAALAGAVQALSSDILQDPHRWWFWIIFDYLVTHEHQSAPEANERK